MQGLNHAKGFLQSKIADRLQTRWTPVIQFVVDESVKKSIEISRLIEQVRAESSPPVASESPNSDQAD